MFMFVHIRVCRGAGVDIFLLALRGKTAHGSGCGSRSPSPSTSIDARSNRLQSYASFDPKRENPVAGRDRFGSRLGFCRQRRHHQ